VNSREELCGPPGQADVARVVAALERFGCFVLRQVVPTSLIDQIGGAARAHYRAMDAAYSSGSLSPETERRSYGYGILRPFEDEIVCADARRMRDCMLSCVLDTPLRDVVTGYLGDRVHLLLEACHVRRQGPGQLGRPVPPHQDASVMKLGGASLLNFWVPLVDSAGAKAPGIELYPAALESLLDCGSTPASNSVRERMYSRFEITEQALEREVAEIPAWTPVLDRGDVLCLNGQVIHRTAFDLEMTHQRYDFEIRFCRSSDLHPEVPGDTEPLSELEGPR